MTQHAGVTISGKNNGNATVSIRFFNASGEMTEYRKEIPIIVTGQAVVVPPGDGGPGSGSENCNLGIENLLLKKKLTGYTYTTKKVEINEQKYTREWFLLYLSTDINRRGEGMKKSFRGNFGVDLIYDIIGCSVFSIGVQALAAPHNLPPGGATGLAVIINQATRLPVSILTFLINLPLLVLANIFLGKRFAIKTIQTVVILSITLELANQLVPHYNGDIMLAVLFAGVLQGIGLALILMRGSTTGGTDILVKLIQMKFPHFTTGRLILVIDAFILLLTAIVYQSLQSAMYALIMVFVATKVIDGIIYGLDKGRMLMIISDKYKEISTAIHREMNRGSTLLKGVGTYTQTDKPVLLCAISTPEFQTIKRIVYTIDSQAFMISLVTDEVVGEGFKESNE